MNFVISIHFCIDLLPSDEDDTAELLKELQKIRKERKEDEERKVAINLRLLQGGTLLQTKKSVEVIQRTQSFQCPCQSYVPGDFLKACFFD